MTADLSSEPYLNTKLLPSLEHLVTLADASADKAVTAFDLSQRRRPSQSWPQPDAWPLAK